MAPTQTQLQQALALRKQNPNLSVRDAVTQVAKPIDNAPIAGQAPAITPTTPVATTAPVSVHDNPNYQSSTTEQYNRNVLAQNQAKAAAKADTSQVNPPAIIGQAQEATAKSNASVATTPVVTPEVKTETPTAQVTPITTAPVTPEPIKTSKSPLDKIDANAITNGKGFVPPTPTDEKGIFSALISGKTIPKLETPEYRTASAKYSDYQKFNGMSQQQLTDNIKQGQITTEMAGLLASNPNFVEARKQAESLQRTKSANEMAQGTIGLNKGRELTTPNYLESISNDIIKKYGLTDTSSQQAFKDIVTNDPKVIEYTNQLSEINRQVAETTKTINDGYKELKQQYQGKLSASQMLTYMSNRFRDATDLLTSLNTTKGYLTADLKNATDMAISEYGAKQADIKRSQDLRDVFMNQELGLLSKQAEIKMAQQYEKPTFTQYGDKVYQVVNGKLTDTGINTASDQWQSANITRHNPLTGANESTPIFYKKKSGGAGFEAVDLAGNPIDANLLGGLSGGGAGATGGYATGTTEMRTDRNNNPTAFTTNIAKQAGLVEGVDYVVGDKFPGSSNMYTAKLIGDPIDTTIRVIDSIGFKTKSGQNRWTYTDKLGLNNDTWSKMSPEEKRTSIKRMYQQEGGNGKAIGDIKQTQESQQYSPDKIKSFEAFNGTAFPSDYKTPAQQKQYRDEYNAWRESRPGVKIETGNDILNIKLDKGGTEGERASQSYTARMLNAVNNLMPLEKKFLELGTVGQVAQTYLPSLLKSSDQKIMEAEKKNFITAVLRKQSGASIAPSEFKGEEIKYFPQPGDSQGVIIAKQNARNAEIKSMLATAGVDIEGNSLSKYYNPPIIIAETPKVSTTTNKIDTYKKNYFTTP